jgi:formate-dependent nitrite reductase membrane component NrfD
VRSVTEVGTEMRSYYGRPVLNEPVWQPEIPWYFFTGGLGGASSVLGRLARGRGNDRLANAALWISLAADTASPVLLISDLGRPERFHHMLRVFKVTSPMSVGSWILACSGTASGIAATAHVLGLERVRNAAERIASALGLPLATYTAVLLSDTAVPVWHEARQELPLLFATSSAATAGAAAAMVTPPEDAGPARRIAVAGAVAENVAMQVMESRLGMVGEPYKQGEAGRYAKLAKGLSLAGAAVLGLAGRRRAGAVAGGALMLAGEACLRWSVFRAGFQSAADPRYTVEPQRERAEQDGSYASSRTGRSRLGGDVRRGAGDPNPG